MMNNTIVVGCYWGDEGKGKIIDFLASGRAGKFYATARATGGNNAGHTVWVNGEQIITHLLPSGMMNGEMIGILGNGMVIDLEALVNEINEVGAKDIQMGDRLFISHRANVIMPYHIAEDRKSGLSKKIGTTGRGIGPAYTDKIARRGIIIGAFNHPDTLKRRVNEILEMKAAHSDMFSGMDADRIVDEQLRFFDQIKRYVADTSLILDRLARDNKNILFEGAQATMLSIDHGTLPYVTSTDCCAGGVCTGTGFGPVHIHRVIGIAKAAPTRVGNGPFPTEMGGQRSELYCAEDGGKKYVKLAEEALYDPKKLLSSSDEFELGIGLRMVGGEYGATTGRPRRCGWPDTVVLDYARRVNGLTQLALTKLDALGNIEKVKVCVGYKIGGVDIEGVPPEECELRQVEPVYEILDGWEGSISHIRKFEQLPAEARDVVSKIEEKSHVPVKFIGVGPERDQLIVRD